MKLWSREALVLGGVYSVLSTPFVYGRSQISEHILSILFIIFALYLVLLCFNKTPKLIAHILNTYPGMSYYLTAIGWIPYFAMIFITGLFVSSYFIENDITSLLIWIGYTLELAIPVSVIIAFIRQKNEK
ncbi:MAG: hypothetical protein J5896_05960 [Alphaproteobacteria bacterium]|nr:hypothetical protein [Alphaproteobacteria bacterium]